MSYFAKTMFRNASESYCLVLEIVAFGAVSLIALSYLVAKFNRHLYSIPGPYLAGFTSLWSLYDVLTGKSHETALRLHSRYGPLVRTGPKHISVSDPNEIITIYGIGNGFVKTAFYDPFTSLYEGKALINTFAARDNAFHSNIKRPIAHLYSSSNLMTFEPKIDEVSVLFIKILKDQFLETGTDIDLGKWLQWYAFDAIGNLTFSRTLGFLEEQCDVDGMISQITNYMTYAAVVGQLPYLHSFLAGNPVLHKLYPAIETFNPAVSFSIKCMTAAQSQKEPAGTRDDYITRFQQLADRGVRGGMRGGPFDSVDIVNHTSANVLAGSDTTAIALRAALINVITDPLIYNRLQKEIDEMDEAGLLPNPTISHKEARQMPYLQAVIKEALRIHPSVAMPLERHVPKGGTTICGKFLPQGTVVGINPWVVSRDRNVYGHDADCFRPERWLEADEEQLKAMERASLAFGAGSRICLGKHISLVEMSKLIPLLLREFDITLKSGKKDLKVENYWFSGQEGLICRLQRRKK